MLGYSFPDFIAKENSHHKRLSDLEVREVSTDARMIIIRLLIVCALFILLSTLIKTQLFAGEYYRELSDNNRIRSIPIHAPRGIIYDKNKTALTINLPAFRLNGELVSKDQAILLESNGQNPEIDSIRSYPLNEIFAHVVGYISATDRVGLGGLEEQYQDVLKGTDGQEIVEVDALGKTLRTLSVVNEKKGSDLDTTLDAKLQKSLYEEMKGKKGAAIASDPKTGAILALVSTPSFDPNVFTDLNLNESYRGEKIKYYFNDPSQIMFDRAISGTFPPGSTYKIVTATAGLETGAINKSTIIVDEGTLVVGPYKFPNWHWLQSGVVEGPLDIVGAIKLSNDIFFYRVGEWTTVEKLTEWSKKLGLGSTLGIDLPGEAKGNIKNERDWYLGDTYHMAIGQGDLLTTPLQVNHWTNLIASDGKLCRPYLVGKPQCLDSGVKPTNIALIKEGMKEACSTGGTGWPMFGFKPQPYCKTGTAEFGDPNNRTHAWFTVFLDEPSISLTILLEGAGEGSDVAAPIAKKVLQEWVKQ